MGNFAILLCVVLVICLVACSGETETVERTAPPEASATTEPATITPVPPTDTASVVAAPNPCDSKRGPCLTVTFDGENCVVEGPTDNQVGWYVFISTNESEGLARIEAARLDEGKTLEDLAEDTAKRPHEYDRSYISPVWLWNNPIFPGETVNLRRFLHAENMASYALGPHRMSFMATGSWLGSDTAR